MSKGRHVLKPGDRNPAMNVIGVQMVVLVSETDSQAQRITLQSGDEGMGPPPHCHDWDESFYVTRGQVQFSCGGENTLCPAGTLVHIPAGTIHAFSFAPGGGEMLEVTGSGSKAIQMFRALNREIPPGPPDIPKIVQVAGEYGVVFHL